MVTTTSSTNAALSAAITAAQSAATTNSTTASTSSSDSSSSSLASLSGNFNTFLTLLTTQLQNQDPTNPMSSDNFTSELAQFSGVEQQVQTNTNLKTLISLTQDGQGANNLSLIGKTATATSSILPLQNSQATVNFTTTTAEPVAIAITNSAGTVVRSGTLDSSAGSNTWTWNGTDDNGNTLADGAYNIAIETADDSGNTTAVPFTVTGTVTGVTNGDGEIDVNMGAAKINMANITSFTGGTPTGSTSTSSGTTSSTTSSSGSTSTGS